ncbi:Polynucleotide 5'-hydroxyl-kinase [Apiospora hydei]|uniref:Polynucleotide 5'-hydroxyl-kinase GRC3 n=1 Tax=Apiospora hydei TaxID=1337664 RepID=A0ABR1WYY4_9PEZI
MATNKRRKLETAGTTTRLKQARAAAVPETPVEAPATLAVAAEAVTTEAEGPKKARRSKRRSPQKQTPAATEEPADSLQDDQGYAPGVRTPYEIPVVAANPEPATPEKSSSPVVRLSNFQPTKSNFKKKAGGKLYLQLSGGERLVILGNYGVRVISGEVTLNGSLLKAADKTHWMQMRKAKQPTFEILFTSADGPKKATLFDLVSPPEWNRKIDQLVATSQKKPVSVMVTGPKSSGKSTFGRLLTNNLLTYYSTSTKRRHAQGIVVLDLDPGQPEYCIAGQIGLVHVTEPLLGPSFCRPLPSSGVNILRSHTLASMSPASDTSLYILAAIDLFNHYRNRLGNCPLVINTAGWVQGIGLDLLTSLVDALRPTDLVYMAPGPVDIVRSLQRAHTRRIYATPVANYTEQFENSRAITPTPTWNVSPLTMGAPWQIKYSGPSQGIMGIMCYGYQTPPNLLADAINGTILAVVEIENPMAFRYGLSEDAMDLDSQPPSSSQGPATVSTPEGLPFINVATTLDPKYSQTIGLALVRGIDVENNILQILTPISDEKIEEINEKQGQIVLVSGKFDPPTWAYTEDLYYGSRTESTGENGSGDIMEVEDDEELGPSFVEEDQQDEVDLVSTSTPWIEVLRGDEKRGAASKVWRVRRDLGRTGATGD